MELNNPTEQQVNAQLQSSSANESAEEAEQKITLSDTCETKPSIAVRVIEPRSGLMSLKLDEIWNYRELVGILAWRDISVRYRQTIVGAAWAIIQPLAMILVFSVIFRRWVGMPSEGTPYPIFTYVAMLPWQYFSTAMSGASSSLLRSSNILTKVYFPRFVIPLSSVLPPLIDFAISFFVLLGMMMHYGFTPNIRWLAVIPLLLLTLMIALGVGLWLSALSIEYRDLAYVIPFVMQVWMFASPVVYPSSMVSWRWREVYALNPLTGIIEGFRWAMLGVNPTSNYTIPVAVAVTFCVFISGFIYFQVMERTFADVI